MTREQTPYIDIFLTNEMVCCTAFRHNEPIHQQPFAMAYTVDDRWVYGQDAISYAQQYPERAILSLSRLLDDEKEMQIAGKTFSSIALLVYYFQQIDMHTSRSMGNTPEAYTLTARNGLTLFQKSRLHKVMEMASMVCKRIHTYTDNIALHLEHTHPADDRYALCIYMDRTTCGLGLYMPGNGVSESLAKQETRSVADESLLPYLISNIAKKYADTGRDSTRLDYPKLAEECSRILHTLDTPGSRTVYLTAVGEPQSSLTLPLDTTEIYGWINPYIDYFLQQLDHLLTGCTLDEIWIDAPGISYTVLQAALHRTLGKTIRKATDTARNGAGLLHGILTGEIKDLLFLDSLPHEITVLLWDGNHHTLVDRHITIPKKNSIRFRVCTHKNHIEIPLFADGRFIGGLVMSSGAKAGNDPLEIEVTIDIHTNEKIMASSTIIGGAHTAVSITLPTEYAMETNFIDNDIFTSALELRTRD